MSFTVILDIPKDILTSAQPISATAHVHRHLRPVMERLHSRVRARTEHDSIRRGYYLDSTLSAAETSIALGNDNPHWLWREIDTRPHEIRQPAHWVPIDALITYLEAKGERGPDVQSHAYALQRWLATHDYVVRHPGTTGDHIVEEEWEITKPRLDDAFEGALSDLLSAGSAGSGRAAR